MTQIKRNYIKFVGSKAFIEAALKKIEPFLSVIYSTPIKESDKEPGTHYCFVNCTEKLTEAPCFDCTTA